MELSPDNKLIEYSVEIMKKSWNYKALKYFSMSMLIQQAEYPGAFPCYHFLFIQLNQALGTESAVFPKEP